MSELLTYLLNNDPQFRKNRLAALYSDFRPLITLNPDGYSANIQAWQHGLSAAALAGVLPSRKASSPSTLTLEIDEDLLSSLETREWGRPLALGSVVNEAIKGHEWVELRSFMASIERVERGGTSRWRVPGVGEVVGWGLRQLGILGTAGGDKLVLGQFVILENLEEVGGKIAKRLEGIRGRTERILSKSSFRESFEGMLGMEKKLSEADLELLLKFLERDKGLLAFDGETVKIKAPGEKLPSAITAEDTTISSLKLLITDLERQTTVLTAKVDELGITAKEAVARKNRVAALAALRSKKLAESTLVKRHATLAQIEEVFTKIEQAADQVELVHVMEGSTKVLSGLNKEVGGVDRVDDVVDQLREQMTQVDEVGNVIAEVGQDTGRVDEGEVDDELEAMEREEREKREAIERAEREKIEAIEKAKREEQEKQEAGETKRKLDALQEVEQQAKEAAKKQAEEPSTAEKELDRSTEEMKRMSLDPVPERIPAS